MPGYAEQGGGRDGTSALTVRLTALDIALHGAGRLRAEATTPRAIGVDEISIRKGHNYRRHCQRPGAGASHLGWAVRVAKKLDPSICFEGAGRKEKRPYQAGSPGYVEALPELGDWTTRLMRGPSDKFHIMRHLSKALDEVRRGHQTPQRQGPVTSRGSVTLCFPGAVEPEPRRSPRTQKVAPGPLGA